MNSLDLTKNKKNIKNDISKPEKDSPSLDPDKCLSGRLLSKKYQVILKREFDNLKEMHGVSAHLHIILFKNDPASLSFIRIKERFANKVGIQTHMHDWSEKFGEKDFQKACLHTKEFFTDILKSQNNIQKIISKTEDIHLTKKEIHTAIIQLPLAREWSAQKILDCIPAQCDVDLLSTSVYKDFKNHNTKLLPPVVGSIVLLAEEKKILFVNKKIVIVGKGILVGQPMIDYCIREKLEYVVIDIDTPEKERVKTLKGAMIIISGVGKPDLIVPGDISEGCVIFDAGTSEQAGKLVGDVHPSCYKKVSFCTPVPGGVGPGTVVVLFKNILLKAQDEIIDSVSK